MVTVRGYARIAALVCLAGLVVGLSISAWALRGPPPFGEPGRMVAAANNDFAWRLYAKAVAGDDGNVFFSPASVHAALSMTRLGAANLTAEQMDDVLGLIEVLEARHELAPSYGQLTGALTPGPDANYELHVANALWGQDGYPWRQSFRDDARTGFRAGLREVDYQRDPDAARQTINAWVEEQTAEKITDLLPEGIVTEATRLILTNAVYFKAEWVEQFDADSTRPAEFHVSADETVEVSTMHQTEFFNYAEDDAVQVLQMGYVGDEVSMLVVLPKDPAGLAEVEHALIEARGSAIFGQLERREVRVALPKVHMTWDADLAALLIQMGMVDPFGADADFSRMTPQSEREEFYISSVIHKAYVDINETGTEAAAATAVVMMGSAPGEPPVEFTADHPFLFMIRHEPTGTILFLGRVVNPAAEADNSAGAEDDS